MMDPSDVSTAKHRKNRWWLVPAALAVLASVGGGLVWRDQRAAARLSAQAGLEALARQDLDAVQVAAESLRGLADYEPHVRLFDGAVLLQSGRLPEAIEQFGHARDHPELSGLAYTLSGEALYKARRFRDADRILTTAVQIDPGRTDAHRWLAALYYDIGAMSHALEQLQIVAVQAPSDPRPHRLRGLIQRDFEKYHDAAADYRESLRRAPELPAKQEILLELAECLLRLLQFDEMSPVLDRCAPSAQSHWLWAECHYGRNDMARARTSIDEAIRLDPSHLEALQLKARLEMDAGRLESAAAILRGAAARHPMDFGVHHRLAQAYQRLGKSDLAKEQNHAATRLRTLRTRFAELHEKAIADPTKAELRYELGVLANQLNRPDLALTWFQAALSLEPDHRGAREAVQAMFSKSPPRQPEAGQLTPNMPAPSKATPPADAKPPAPLPDLP